MSDTIHPFWKIVGIGIVVVIAINWYQTRPLTEPECYRLGSNERMNSCLASLRSPTPEPIEVDGPSLSKIVISGATVDSTGRPYITGSIKNNLELPVEDVIIRVRLYKYSKTQTTCDNTQLDTQYIKLERTLIPQDSYLIGEYFDKTLESFNWCLDIASATYIN